MGHTYRALGHVLRVLGHGLVVTVVVGALALAGRAAPAVAATTTGYQFIFTYQGTAFPTIAARITDINGTLLGTGTTPCTSTTNAAIVIGGNASGTTIRHLYFRFVSSSCAGIVLSLSGTLAPSAGSGTWTSARVLPLNARGDWTATGAGPAPRVSDSWR